ncbi:MAG TPA: hypothetical protein VJJ52_06650 [Candidatus Nanoarchaeia archaeon]|nr:hypothetical protein [Candidatus Nanoarchaeia archaeon]
MKKKISVFSGLMIILSILMSTLIYAASFDVSIDRVRVNGQVVSESRSNFVADADVFSVIVDSTTVETLEKGHVEASLRGRQSGNVVSDATSTFDFGKNQTFTSAFTLRLIDKLTRENDYDLTIKIVDSRGRSEQKTYEVKTKQATLGRALDVSIDRVKVNGQVAAQSSTNFIDESNTFDILAEFTALENLNNAHVETVLTDLNSGNVVADASPNFNLASNLAASRLLRVELLNGMKNSNSFELTVKLKDADGNSISQAYGLRMRNGNSASFGNDLDVSVNSVEVENNNIVEGRTNFISLSGSKKDLSLRVKFTPREDLNQAHIDAVMTFENGDSVSDTALTFDASKDQETTKTFKLSLINSKFAQGNFDLRLSFVDDDGNTLEKNYQIKITPQKDPFAASIISLSPEGSVQAGKSLGVAIGLKNTGVQPLESIVLRVSISELDVSSSKFIDQFKDGQTTDFILKIPEGAPAGTYSLRTEITSQSSGNTETRDIPVTVVGKTLQPSVNQLAVSVPFFEQNLNNDGSEVIYPVTLKNNGMSSNVYTILLHSNDNVNLRLGESNVFILGASESKTVNVYASSTGKSTGKQTFFVDIKSGDKLLNQVVLRANISGTSLGYFSGLKSALMIVLIVTAILLAGIGLFFGFVKNMQPGNKQAEESNNLAEEIPDMAEGEAYY